MRARAPKHARGDRVARRTAHHQPILDAQRLARILREPIKRVVCALQKWNVIRMLKVRQSDDATAAMR